MSEFAGDEVLEAFIKEREFSGDFIAKVSDRIWLKEAIDSLNTNAQKTIAADFSDNTPQFPEQVLSFLGFSF